MRVQPAPLALPLPVEGLRKETGRPVAVALPARRQRAEEPLAAEARPPTLMGVPVDERPRAAAAVMDASYPARTEPPSDLMVAATAASALAVPEALPMPVALTAAPRDAVAPAASEAALKVAAAPEASAAEPPAAEPAAVVLAVVPPDAAEPGALAVAVQAAAIEQAPSD